MTLYRQIALLMSAILLLLLGMTAWTNFHQATRLLQGQMQTTADDMATNLGVTIANTVEGYDRARIETLFNAVFDSGYFTNIELYSPEGKPIVVRTQAVEGPGVPQWFVEAVPLQPAIGRTQVMKGWFPYGTLSLTLHPGYVYGQLYQTLATTLLWFVVLAVAGLLSLALLLRWVLRPLAAMERQAAALQENRFISHDPLPRTPELRRVAAAMNRMVEKVQAIFHDQAATLRRHEDLLYRDQVTGIPNRARFTAHMDELLRDESLSGGSLVMVQFGGLLELNRRHGFEFTNKLLRELGEILVAQLPAGHGALAARLNATDFVVCLPLPISTSKAYAEAVFDSFRTLLARHSVSDVSLCAGLVSVHATQNLGQLLANADLALAHARLQPPWAALEYVAGGETPRGKQQWREWLERMLAERRFFLAAQPVLGSNGARFHGELLLRLRDADGVVHTASGFMPMAASLDLASAIERESYRLIVAACSRQPGPLAMNLPVSIFTDSAALAEFERFLQQFRATSQSPLFVEIPHHALTRHPALGQHLATMLRQANCAFGIDYFDVGGDLAILQKMPPAYVKIDARRLARLAADPALFQPLQTITRSLDVHLVASGVESPELQETLRDIDGIALQGNLIAPPEELP